MKEFFRFDYGPCPIFADLRSTKFPFEQQVFSLQQKFCFQEHAWRMFDHLMTGIEQRLERAKDIQVETIKLTKKTIKELCGANNDRKVMGGNASGKGENAEEVIYKGKDLTKLTGETPEITPKNIATALFSPDELSKVVIDPHNTLPGTCRTPADEFRTSLYRKAVRGALGSQYSDACTEILYDW